MRKHIVTVLLGIASFTLAVPSMHRAVSETMRSDQTVYGGTIDPSDFGAVNDGITDDTRPLNQAIALAAATRRTLLLKGSYGVTTLDLHGSPAYPINVTGNAVVNGISPSAQAAILDVGSWVNINGQIDVYGGFRATYRSCIWFHGIGGAAAQFTNFTNVAPAGCLIGWRIGDVAYPNAIVSEVTVFGGHTYGTAVAVQAEGNNTVVSFIGTSPIDGSLGSVNVANAGWFDGQSATSASIISSGTRRFVTKTGLAISAGMPISAVSKISTQNYMTGTVSSYDGATGVLVMDVAGAEGSGTFTSWQLSPPTIGIRAIGAQVRVNGGEVQQAQQFGSLVEMRPLEGTLGNGRGRWPIVELRGVNADSTGLILSAINPGAVAIDDSFYGTFILDGLSGYIGYDVSPALNTPKDFYGKIFLQKNNLLARSVRSNFNIVAGSTNTIIYTDPAGLGMNFKDANCGISGGTVSTWQQSQPKCQ
jgi:hypothetical protein